MAVKGWYKQMAVYQIWTRSFCDGNGDGIGDLWGVLSKLDYIKSLNVDAIWFSPLYPSPNADYGYDISDYTDIAPEYGDLDVFRQVLEEAHRRGLRVFMDLVINHTSDEHRWFKESGKGRDNPYHDYYYRRPARYIGKKRLPPNNWTSYLEGDAWEYDEHSDEYYLHLFAVKQPDLNMDNPKVREEVKKIMRFWLEMGVDGFREDAITCISKAPGLPGSFPGLPSANGKQHFTNRPDVYGYLREFRREVLDGYDCFVIGEGSETNAATALRYITEGPDKVLDEMIGFDHMTADRFMNDMLVRPFDLKKMKRAFTDWQKKLEGRGWNALYLENHDQPRIISRYGSEIYRKESGKMLAAMYNLQRGTPFVYQGQEIGMLNVALPRLDMYKDIMTFNTAKILSRFMSPERVLECVRKTSRDNARTPMQWDGSANAGFTRGTPWFGVNPNYHRINVESEEKDPDSILNFYRKLLKFKKENEIALYGSYRELMPESKKLYVYERRFKNERLLVVCSFTNEQVRFEPGIEYSIEDIEPVLSNYEHNFVISNGFTTRPYEMRVYHFK